MHDPLDAEGGNTMYDVLPQNQMYLQDALGSPIQILGGSRS
ncbi:MAG: hypothetical protein WB797_12495 [Nocardioides sp.]